MLLRILDRLEEIIIASLMAAATILIFISVVHRFGTGVPFLYDYLILIHISWAQELCIYMFIWMAKFTARLLPDVLSLSAGVMDLLQDRRPAAS
jgi:C4-dicarboxylate transporter, DctQ subunit